MAESAVNTCGQSWLLSMFLFIADHALLDTDNNAGTKGISSALDVQCAFYILHEGPMHCAFCCNK